MPSVKTTSALVVATVATIVKADYIIDPESVSASLRASWCQSELSTCPIICNQVVDGEPLVNDCDPDALTYGCICSDGSRPNVTEYTLTLPYFTCQEWGNQCVTACAGDNVCSNSCRVDNPCGAQEPTPANKTKATSSTSDSSSATADTEDAVNTNVLGSDIGGDDNAAVAMAGSYGLAIIAATLFAGFAIL